MRVDPYSDDVVLMEDKKTQSIPFFYLFRDTCTILNNKLI